jgi:hypothetical protein
MDSNRVAGLLRASKRQVVAAAAAGLERPAPPWGCGSRVINGLERAYAPMRLANLFDRIDDDGVMLAATARSLEAHRTREQP